MTRAAKHAGNMKWHPYAK